MAELREAIFLNVKISSDKSGAPKLYLVGATGTQYKNTKDPKVTNYTGMMTSKNKELQGRQWSQTWKVCEVHMFGNNYYFEDRPGTTRWSYYGNYASQSKSSRGVIPM